MNKISSLMFAVAFSSVGLISCQSPEDKVAQAEQELKEVYVAKVAERDKQIRQYVDSTPDLYRISWKVCGDYMAPYSSGEERCNETRNPRTKGYVEPAYVWGANEVKFVNKQNFVSNFNTTGLFVKSQGCLNSGNPQEEQYYNVRDFMLKKGTNTPLAKDVKLEVLSKEEKQMILSAALRDAQIEISSLKNFGVSSNGLIPHFSQAVKNQFT